MHSFIKYDGFSDNSSLSLSSEIYEDLAKENSDRYEIILPRVKYSKNLSDVYNLGGNLIFDADMFQKQYETNKYEQNLNNVLTFFFSKKIRRYWNC